jgi:thioredoxin-dependent peroxiredoxin
MNIILSSLLITLLNMSAIQKGNSIPNLILADQNGKVYNLQKETKGKPTVVYFYPKDDTPGCTAEACSFRDNHEDFLEMGAVVIGISGDNPASHKKFAEKYNLPYTLLSDPKKEARKAFNVPTDLLGLIPGRVTYIFDKKGVCQGVFKSQTKATQHIDEALKILKSIE